MSSFSFPEIALAAIPLLPLLGFLVNGLWGRRLSQGAVSIVGCGSILASFLLSLYLFVANLSGLFTSKTITLFDWIPTGSSTIGFALLADPLSILMLLIVTGIGFLIHLYSTGYMHDDEGYARFFAYLNLFVFSMLLLVLGANFPMMFVGWEGVGLCSFLLIGFWYKNTEYNAAAKKAFVMNRIGDLGFLLGMFLIFSTFGSLNYSEVFASATGVGSNSGIIIAITLLLFVGAAGKSAQIPLYTWLPDAMAGPTPVSALIHAATMVTAGIYMIARCNVLYSLAPTTLNIILVVGIFTALMAATIAVFQNDIKKVLAYSTVSQLGYMFAAMGVGAYTAGMFHVLTHAFFKALLFLGAGAVIHALHHEQDIRRMGGLRTHLPAVYRVFFVGTMAISGIPILSGFFSKDEILLNVFQHSIVAWALLLAGSLLTAMYMFRLLYLTFAGEYRGDKHTLEHIHQPPTSMQMPLNILMILSIVGGLIGLPEFTHLNWLHHYLSPVMEGSEGMIGHSGHLSLGLELGLMGLTVGLIIAVIFRFINGFNTKPISEFIQNDQTPMAWYKRLPANKYYVDEIYDALIVKPLNALSLFFHRVLDIHFFDGIVNGIGEITLALGKGARMIQSGDIGYYLFAMVFGVIGILLLFLFM